MIKVNELKLLSMWKFNKEKPINDKFPGYVNSEYIIKPPPKKEYLIFKDLLLEADRFSENKEIEYKMLTILREEIENYCIKIGTPNINKVEGYVPTVDKTGTPPSKSGVWTVSADMQSNEDLIKYAKSQIGSGTSYGIIEVIRRFELITKNKS